MDISQEPIKLLVYALVLFSILAILLIVLSDVSQIANFLGGN